MRLKYFTDDAIRFFKANQEEFCKKMCENPTSTEWLLDFYGSNPMVSSNLDFDFSFKQIDASSNVEDFENAVALYELFQSHNIGPSTIYNEKFLSGFIFTFGYEYFMRVIGADKTTHVFSDLFFSDGIRRAVVKNVVGKLYRFVEMTVDEDLADKYELTRFVFKNKAVLRIKYNTNIDGEKTMRSMIEAFKEWTEETGNPLTDKIVEAVKVHATVLANVSEIELSDQRELINDLKDFMNRNYRI